MMCGRSWRVLVVLFAVSGCARETGADRFARWMGTSPNAAQADAYATYLRGRKVGDILPLSQLLRSGRSWRRCNVDEFAVPPRVAWPAMVATLELVRELQRRRLLDAALPASVYRSDAFNRCEGGSRLSRHRLNNAIDFDLPPDPDRVSKLCRYWRENGARLRFGLGFYDNRRIHVDTSGFRTWGSDYTRMTSLCTVPH
jgi:uncharacterized protein YcbK (DUF882 family)